MQTKTEENKVKRTNRPRHRIRLSTEHAGQDTGEQSARQENKVSKTQEHKVSKIHRPRHRKTKPAQHTGHDTGE